MKGVRKPDLAHLGLAVHHSCLNELEVLERGVQGINRKGGVLFP